EVRSFGHEEARPEPIASQFKGWELVLWNWHLASTITLGDRFLVRIFYWL
ncbi:MAG: hypothetical protein F6K41_35000, partial [Symploca sp. SIO3E6]|nr:hypothetical protein [Caldora sp. SIO3E6]